MGSRWARLGGPYPVSRESLLQGSLERDGHARGHGMTHGEVDSPTCSCMTHTCSFMTLLTARLPHPPRALGPSCPHGSHLRLGLRLPGSTPAPGWSAPDAPPPLHASPLPACPVLSSTRETTPGTLIPSASCTHQPSHPWPSPPPICPSPPPICPSPPSIRPSLHPTSRARTPLNYCGQCRTKES